MGAMGKIGDLGLSSLSGVHKRRPRMGAKTPEADDCFENSV